ncbi:M28 family peptidase [Flavobacteriaceae bacterium S0825]|uniref:M28 family peptidase n=1 Tax=Gaetbulibacter sp. S0825 TaxID=2720084 RepID=UPI001430AF99|nr:M28 family peptidase [Gaetbulibacter sp. S0825]MCK0108195.1 M28 family peptidase [Flavobacteriaceae bacterium S0825]NIX63831.1 M28 family peptidase [Gaetbulibacter sp. S0825]
MSKKFIYLLTAFTIIFFSCKKTNEITTQEYFDIVNQELTGDLAYETTAFVEKYWRVVGNTGFNKSVYRIAEQLEKDGYVLEENAIEDDFLTYRIETRPLKRPTWESVDATVTINGEENPLLTHDTNRNMIALNSYSTAEEGDTAEVVYIEDIKKLGETDVKGKIVFAETHPGRIFKTAVTEGGAVGIITYNNPDYLQPEKNTTSIQFRSIPLDSVSKAWGIAMSFEAKERLKNSLSKGKTTLNVKVETNIYPSEELTIVADIKGRELPKERLAFSAHIQEPGANDNASGVGATLEMASVAAKLFKDGRFLPRRTLTFLWGDEIVSTRRYVEEDSIRAKDIKWGISLDMVGEDTEKTGGSFLIEKMPDPSAIWTRGNDKHTEWGGRPLKVEDMTPHYLNDFVIEKFKEQGRRANWIVNTNPYEGGSDHVPFLRGNIPSVLFWHFTDQFYHTDNDRIDKVSKTTLKNVATGALVSAIELVNSDETTAKRVLESIEQAAMSRLEEEQKQSELAIENGDTLEEQIEIINTWKNWYIKAASTTSDMVNDESQIKSNIEATQKAISDKAKSVLEALETI